MTRHVSLLVGAEGHLVAQVQHQCGHVAEHIYPMGRAQDLVRAQAQPCQDCRQGEERKEGQHGS